MRNGLIADYGPETLLAAAVLRRRLLDRANKEPEPGMIDEPKNVATPGTRVAEC